MYPYRAYIEHLLSYGPAAKECQLTGVMWYKDTPGQQDKRTTDNKGFTTRNKNDVLSKSIKMMGKLHLDLFCQEKYFLNHVDLKMKLRRSRDAFALVADAANYKIKIKKMALYVRKVQLSPVVRMGHVKALEKTSCKYPVRPVEVKVDTVPTSYMNYFQNNMILGQLLKRLVIAFIDSDALNGTIGKICSISNTTRSILWHSTLTDDRYQPNVTARLRKQWLHPKLYGTNTEKCIKAKEIPF